MLSALRTLWQQWKEFQDRTTGRFYNTSNHTCRPRVCELEPVPLFRHSNGELTLQQTHAPVTRDEAALLVCKQTGTAHFCGSGVCDVTVDTDGGDVVCKFTGTVLKSRRVATGRYGDVDTSMPSWYVPKRVKEFSTETLFERATQIPATARFPRPKGKREFLAQVLVLITSVFSKERFEKEFEEHKNYNQTIMEELKKYLSRCNAKRVFPDVLEMTVLVASLRRRLDSVVRMQLTDSAVKTLSVGYAIAVMALWHVLRTYARDAGGAKIATAVGMRDFVVAMLETCQTGLHISDKHRRYEVEVLPLDPVLHVVKITPAAQEVVLGKSKNLTRIRKTVRETLQRAVDEHDVNPESLRLTTYDFSSLPEDAFVCV